VELLNVLVCRTYKVRSWYPIILLVSILIPTPLHIVEKRTSFPSAIHLTVSNSINLKMLIPIYNIRRRMLLLPTWIRIRMMRFELRNMEHRMDTLERGR
jgi:hypothetical protein